MKKIQLVILFCLFGFLLKGQKKYDPKIIFLIPQKVEISDNVIEDVSVIKKEKIFVERDFMQNKYDSLQNELDKNDSISKNLKVHLLNQLEFCYNLNFDNYIIKEYSSRFQKELGEKFNNLLVQISPNKSLADQRFLTNLTNMERADYIILTELLKVNKEGDGISVKPVFKVYSGLEEKIICISELLTESYNNDTIVIDDKQIIIKYDNNFATQVQEMIVQNGNALSREMNKKRNVILSKMFEANKTNDTIKGIIAFLDLDVDISNYHSALFDSSTNQLLAFFIEKSASAGSNDTTYVIDLVYFSKKSKKWKYKFVFKDAVSASNLQEGERLKGMLFNFKNYNLFLENSIAFNEKFWKKKLFLDYEVRF